MKLGVAIGLVLALALLGCTPGEFSGSLDQRFPTAPGGRLQVDLDLGDEARSDRVTLEVRSHEADEVWAVADVSGPGASAVSFRVEHDASGVRVYGRAGGLLSWLFGGPSVQIRIFVPREFSIDVRSASGPILIENVSGELRARTAQGKLEVRGADGPMRIRTSGGPVEVTEARGSVDVRALSGSIELAWISGPVDARTCDGDVTARHLDGGIDLRTDAGAIDLQDVRGTVLARTESGSVSASFLGAAAGELETQRGSIEVSLPAHLGLALDARSGLGSVEVVDGLAIRGERSPERVTGTLNGGGESLRIYTARGSVRVSSR